MKKFFQSMIALAVLVAAGIPFSARAAEDEDPIITLFSDAQKEGAGDSASLWARTPNQPIST